MESITGALENSMQVAFDRWHEWASQQRDFIIGGKPGITEEQYEAVVRRFAAIGNHVRHIRGGVEPAGSAPTTY